MVTTPCPGYPLGQIAQRPPCIAPYTRSKIGAADSDDDAVLAATLAEVADCRWCLMSVVMALVHSQIAILDDTRVAWRPVLERHLLKVLDDMEP
jgi:hypothetical protein